MVMSSNLYKNSISIGENRTKIAQSHLAVALNTKHAQGTKAELILSLKWEVEPKQSYGGDGRQFMMTSS